MNLLNMSYSLDNSNFEYGKFIRIWKTEVDDSYNVKHPDGLPYNGLIIVYEGEGKFILSLGNKNQKEYTLLPGNFVIIKKGIPLHYWCSKGKIWKQYFIFFENLKVCTQFGVNLNKKLNFTSISKVKNICDTIISEITQKTIGYQTHVNMHFNNLLILLLREYKKHSDKWEERINKVKLWIHNNIQAKIKVKDLIRISGMKRTTFFKRFKEIEKLTPIEYFLNLKLESAKLMLRTTSKKIWEIAEHFNFYDEYYFSKLFKKKYSISPLKYRKQKEEY